MVSLLDSVPAPGPLVPSGYRVVDRRREADDVVTLLCEPLDGATRAFHAGQFNMVTAFGVGEVAVSVSSAPGDPGPIEHTVRDVGAVTHALCESKVGSVLGIRGPYGTDWGVEQLADHDVVVVAGGIGLAPLRGAVRQMVDHYRGGRVIVLVGARSPDQVVFGEDIAYWRRAGAEVGVTVDVGDPSWMGPVGVVTKLLASQGLEPEHTTAMVCGPEVMMRFTARALVERGIAPDVIRLSLERNMQCGIGLCGHCQLGPLLLCRDGPIVTYGGLVSHLISERER